QSPGSLAVRARRHFGHRRRRGDLLLAGDHGALARALDRSLGADDRPDRGCDGGQAAQGAGARVAARLVGLALDRAGGAHLLFAEGGRAGAGALGRRLCARVRRVARGLQPPPARLGQAGGAAPRADAAAVLPWWSSVIASTDG